MALQRRSRARDGGLERGNDTAVVFSRDGRRLYTGNEDGRIRVWETDLDQR